MLLEEDCEDDDGDADDDDNADVDDYVVAADYDAVDNVAASVALLPPVLL